MKKNIHPELHEVEVRCASCANSFTTSTTATEMKLTICSNCHPFYTGKQKFVDTAGRIDKFNKKFNK